VPIGPVGDPPAGLVGRGRAGLRAEILQRRHPPRADHPVGRVRHGGEHTDHRAGVVDQRAVGVRPVRLLPVPVPVHRQQHVVRPGRLPRGQHAVQHRADDVPDLRPHRRSRLVQRRMLGAEQRQIGVVVEEAQFGAPPQDHREPRGQADAHRRAQALGPAVGGAERRRGPVEGAHPRGHLAAAGENVTHRLGRPLCHGTSTPSSLRQRTRSGNATGVLSSSRRREPVRVSADG
jgi:hypothetical protein